MRPAGRADPLVDPAEKAQLGIASHERAEHLRHRLRSAAERDHRGRVGAAHALRLDRPRRSVGDMRAGHLSGERTDENLAGFGALLKARADDHRPSRHQELGALAVAGHDFPGVDANAKSEARTDARGGRAHEVAKGDRRANRALGVVLMRDGHAEHGHDRVADELLDGRPVLDEDLAHSRERPAECGAKHFGVVRPGRPARIHDVRKEDGHDLPFLRHGPSLRAP